MCRYKTPIEYEVLNLQQIAHRVGWEDGKRTTLEWVIEFLRGNGHAVAADFVESQVFGQAMWGIKQTTRFQRREHQKSHQASQVKAPDTSVQWPGNAP